jgi:MFS transporter, UMF1 family
MTDVEQGIANLEPLSRRKEQRAWYWYDWANSGYVTTVATVLFAPYLTSVAEQAACGFVGDSDRACTTNLDVLGLSVSPGSLVFYIVTLATIVSALVLPVVGAAADRSPRKKQVMAGFAWTGSLAAGCMFFVTGTNWELGAALLFVANICLGSSLVVYDAILCEISTPDERDRVSSRGWALGYLGGGLLLALNLAVVTLHDSIGLSTAMAVRLSLLSAAFWWAGFTFIPYLGIRNRPALGVVPESGGLVRQSFGQLFVTLRDMRNYPVTLTFLVAYLFYNDGIQTVIASASVYGGKELGFGTSTLIATILLVQFVAFAGALIFGKAAELFGARKVILAGLGIWMLVVTAGYFLPE